MNPAQRAAVEFAPVRIAIEHLPGGGFILRSEDPLRDCEGNLCAYLRQWAQAAPERTFLAARRATGEWRQLSYRLALDQVRAIAQALLEHGLDAGRPIMILSENSIENALLQLGALYAGVPVAPVSPAYSLMSRDFAKLRYIHELLQPSLVYAEDGQRYQGALAALDLVDTLLVTGDAPPQAGAGIAFSELIRTRVTAAVDAAYAGTGPDTLAKILFTSGSTGEPKGVLNTQRMLCSNQQAIVQIWPFVSRRPPVLVDWLPWSHTFGSNHNFNLILRNGGTLYIDTGRPAPGLIEPTIANLREIAPTLYFNVPRGYQALLPYLERDHWLRDHFFSNLDTIFYAAAALPQDLWERLEKLSLAARGEKVAMTSAWGLTETAPLATGVHFPIARAGVIGVPVPGLELKMIPDDGKLEMRVRGPHVTPGYYKREDLTREAFDEDGFYRTGDAGRLAAADDPSRGILFDGRLAENFKLLTGSWVNTGAVRIAAVSAGAPLIQDAVVTGHDRDEIGLLVFPNVAACADAAGLPADAPIDEILGNTRVRDRLAACLGAGNEGQTGSSRIIARALLMREPADIDAGEITDKGYINQRAVLERRQALVACLYSDAAEVIRIRDCGL